MMVPIPIPTKTDLGPAAKAFIDRVSDFVGGAFEPMQKKRLARAEAANKILEAETEIQIDLTRRTVQRWLVEEETKQQNMEAITYKAIPHLKEDTQPQEIDNDWLSNFFDNCRITSDKQMQELWGRLLAGEANEPGKYSKRTVFLLTTLGKTEAMQFSAVCRFIWIQPDSEPIPIIFTILGSMIPGIDEIYAQAGISYLVLRNLAEAGLIEWRLSGHNFLSGFSSPIVFRHDNNQIIVDPSRRREQGILCGEVFLTQAGMELATLCDSPPIPGYFEYVLERWHEADYILSSPYPRVSSATPK